MATSRILLAAHECEPKFAPAQRQLGQSSLKPFRLRNFSVKNMPFVVVKLGASRTPSEAIAREHVADRVVDTGNLQRITIKLACKLGPRDGSNVYEQIDLVTPEQAEKLLDRDV